MKLHPRHFAVEKAQNDLHGAVLEWLTRHEGLTYAEAIYCMSYALDRLIGMAVKAERGDDELLPINF